MYMQVPVKIAGESTQDSYQGVQQFSDQDLTRVCVCVCFVRMHVCMCGRM